MARILVATPTDASGRFLQRQLGDLLTSHGHVVHDLDGPLAQVLHDADGVLATDDGPGSAALAGALVAGKPTLALIGETVPAWLEGTPTARMDGDLDATVARFVESVHPFAGRLVRDQIPQLVKEAGYDLSFRALAEDEKPRFLKQKIHAEATELLKADRAHEKEEVGDILEAMEAFIEARGFEREDLRTVKDAKRKRRGGFERCWVVQETTPTDAEPSPRDENEDESTSDGWLSLDEP